MADAPDSPDVSPPSDLALAAAKADAASQLSKEASGHISDHIAKHTPTDPDPSEQTPGDGSDGEGRGMARFGANNSPSFAPRFAPGSGAAKTAAAMRGRG